MDEIISCPRCHQTIKSTDYFCFNCGQKIHEPPLSTSLQSQTILYIKTILLPPLGILWGFRYLRQSDTNSKIVGLLAIIFTVVVIIVATQLTMALVNTATQQINQQSQLYGM